MLSGHSRKRTIWNRIGYWAAEILVVFIGVYLAFMLDGYRTEKQNEGKKQQVYAGLYKYFALITPQIKRSAQYVDSTYAKPFLEAYQNDETPRLEPLPYFTQAVDESTWKAMLQSGGIDLLDASFIINVDLFFATNSILAQEITHFNRMQDEYLLPNANADITTFYNPETKKLRPLYRWYAEYLRRNSSLMGTMKRQADDIIADLKEKMNRKQLQKIKADSLKAVKEDSLEKARADSLEKAKEDSTA